MSRVIVYTVIVLLLTCSEIVVFVYTFGEQNNPKSTKLERRRRYCRPFGSIARKPPRLLRCVKNKYLNPLSDQSCKKKIKAFYDVFDEPGVA